MVTIGMEVYSVNRGQELVADVASPDGRSNVGARGLGSAFKAEGKV